MKPLDRVGASMYLTEVINLGHYILHLLSTAEQARSKWLTNDAIAQDQAKATDGQYSQEAFYEAGRNTVSAQGEVFEVFEATCAAWARLSLLLFPIEGTGERNQWRAQRGIALQKGLGLDSTNLLANRAFRDSWMHFDERMDLAFQNGWLGNRQQFTRTGGVASALTRSVRVFDMELLAFHYLTQDGTRGRVLMVDLRACIEDLLARFPMKSDSLSFLPHIE